MLEEFRNEPFTDFSRAENRSAFEAALTRVERGLGLEVPLVVGGRRVKTGKLLKNPNPADRSQIVSVHHMADRAVAGKALDVATKAQKDWARVSPRERA